jgi:hypothetical protein
MASGCASVLGGMPRWRSSLLHGRLAFHDESAERSLPAPSRVLANAGGPDPIFTRPAPIATAELASLQVSGVRAVEISDYVFGNYRGDFRCPPHADGNPKKAIVIVWQDKPYKLVFSHEASYSPWIELPSGAGADFQFFESNFGGELFNQYGRMERNSFVDIIESGPVRVWVRWSYFDVDEQGNGPVVRGTDDFVTYPNGIVWRRQTYSSFFPDNHKAHCASPLDFFAAIPAGVHYSEVLRRDKEHGDYLVGAFLDAYSAKQYNVYWDTSDKPKWDGPFYARRTGADWFLDIERSPGRAAVQTFRDGLAYCAFGDASGYPAERTMLWDNSHPDTSPCNWGNVKMIHWPIGWINSGGVIGGNRDILTRPYHIDTLSMCFVKKPFPMNVQARSWPSILKDWNDPEQERWVEGRVFYCLHGVEQDFSAIREVTRRWLDQGTDCARPESVEHLRQG